MSPESKLKLSIREALTSQGIDPDDFYVSQTDFTTRAPRKGSLNLFIYSLLATPRPIHEAALEAKLNWLSGQQEPATPSSIGTAIRRMIDHGHLAKRPPIPKRLPISAEPAPPAVQPLRSDESIPTSTTVIVFGAKLADWFRDFLVEHAREEGVPLEIYYSITQEVH